MISLPPPEQKGTKTLEETFMERKCIRRYANRELSLKQIGQILWAGNGRKVDTVSGATKTVPSAGALYPVELFLVAADVEGLSPGLYHYSSSEHALDQLRQGDFRSRLSNAALGQYFIKDAPASIIIGSVVSRCTKKYGARGKNRYVYMDSAHSAQNIFLQVTALELGTVTVGAFHDTSVSDILGNTKAEPHYIMPVGYQAE